MIMQSGRANYSTIDRFSSAENIQLLFGVLHQTGIDKSLPGEPTKLAQALVSVAQGLLNEKESDSIDLLQLNKGVLRYVKNLAQTSVSAQSEETKTQYIERREQEFNSEYERHMREFKEHTSIVEPPQPDFADPIEEDTVSAKTLQAEVETRDYERITGVTLRLEKRLDELEARIAKLEGPEAKLEVRDKSDE